MKRAPFIDMKKGLFQQTLGAEAKENNVPGQKKWKSVTYRDLIPFSRMKVSALAGKLAVSE